MNSLIKLYGPLIGVIRDEAYFPLGIMFSSAVVAALPTFFYLGSLPAVFVALAWFVILFTFQAAMVYGDLAPILGIQVESFMITGLLVIGQFLAMK